MAFTSSEKQKIRDFIGYSPFFQNANSTLESAIKQVEEQYSDAETAIKANIVILDDINSKLLIVATASIAGDVENVKIEAVTATNLLEKQGRKYIKSICTALGYTSVLSDYYSPAKSINSINSRNSSEFNGYSW